MRVAILDDDAELRDALYQYVDRELLLLGDMGHTITVFSSGEEFLSVWSEGSFDLIILDIMMGELTGVDVARRIRETDDTVRLAFCSSSNEYATESYEVAAHYYLTKPISQERVAGMFRRLGLKELEKTRRVVLPDGKLVRPRDVLYTEYSKHTVDIRVRPDETITVRASHGDIEACFSEYGHFFSPYKGVLVNLREVLSLNEESFTMSDGTVLPIARRKQKEAKAAYLKCKMKKSEEDLS